MRINFTNGKDGGSLNDLDTYAGGISILNNGCNLTVHLHSCLIANNTRRNIFIGVKFLRNPLRTSMSIFKTNITSGKGVKGVGLAYYVFSRDYSTDTFPFPCTTMDSTNALTLSHTKFASNAAERSASGLLMDFYDTQCTYNVILITHCEFTGNHINSSSIKHGTGTAVQLMRHILPDLKHKAPFVAYAIAFDYTNFVDNFENSTKGAVVEIINSKDVEISNCRFICNKGTALSLHSSSVIFSGKVTFKQNLATYGAAIHLCERSFFYLKRSTHITFSNNHATRKGGAIYDLKACLDKHVYCFYQPIASKPTAIINFQNESRTRLIFENNTAKEGGHDIYGGDIDHCYTYGLFYETPSHQSHYLSEKVFNAISYFKAPQKNSISSDPFHLNFCNSTTSEKKITIWPGKTTSVSLQPIGQRNSATTGNIEVDNFDNQISASTSHVFSNSSCYDINVTITANRTEIDTTLKFRLQNSVSIEDVAEAKLHIHITSCPWGFDLKTNLSQCKCHGVISSHGCDCSAGDGTINCQYVHWLGCGSRNTCNNGDEVMEVSCSKSYCNSSLIQSNNIDAQCISGRTGIGCRLCLHTHSAVLGSSDCRICTHSKLWLLAIHLVSGILLITILIKFDITVTYGSLYGVIFYANLVYNNYRVYPPVSDKNFLYIILSWINLDHGIVVCLYKGMTAYHKVWLEFGYIFYLWFLQLVIVYLCRKYVFFTRLCSRNVTNAMATIILLTYMKALRLISTVLNLHHIRSSSGIKRSIWLEVPDKQLSSAQYLILLLVAIVLGVLILSFTTCLLTIQVLKKFSNFKLLSWVPKFQTFFEAFTGPCNNEYTFWPGFLFLMRITVVLMQHISKLIEINMIYCMVTVCVIVFSFLFPSGVYRKWGLNILELSVMLNLAVYYGSLNLISVWTIHRLTIASVSLIAVSLLCYKIKDTRKAWRDIFLYVQKKVSYIRKKIQVRYKASDHSATSSNNERVTQSEIQISIPPNETSQLFHVGSARHARSLKIPRKAKSFKDSRETLLECDS